MERISKFADMEIIGSDGDLLGWAKGFSFAAVGDWRVTGVAVKLEKESHEELGVKKPLMGGAIVDLNIESIRTVGDNIVLKEPQRKIKPHLKAYTEGKNIANVVEKQVIDKDGKDLGLVVDVMLDTTSWRFPSLLIKLDKEVLELLRKGKCPDCERHVTLPILNVSSIGDNVMLSISKDRLGDLVQKAPVKTM